MHATKHFLCAALAVVGFSYGSPAAAQTNWTVYTYTPAATLGPARGLSRIAEAPKETNGALKLIHPSRRIVADRRQRHCERTVRQRHSDGDDGFFQGNLPVTGIMRLPMLITSQAELEKASSDAPLLRSGI